MGTDVSTPLFVYMNSRVNKGRVIPLCAIHLSFCPSHQHSNGPHQPENLPLKINIQMGPIKRDFSLDGAHLNVDVEGQNDIQVYYTEWFMAIVDWGVHKTNKSMTLPAGSKLYKNTYFKFQSAITSKTYISNTCKRFLPSACLHLGKR